MKGKAAAIDDYLARVSPEQGVALEKLRKIIRATAPKGEECISYQVPAFLPNACWSASARGLSCPVPEVS